MVEKITVLGKRLPLDEAHWGNPNPMWLKGCQGGGGLVLANPWMESKSTDRYTVLWVMGWTLIHKYGVMFLMEENLTPKRWRGWPLCPLFTTGLMWQHGTPLGREFPFGRSQEGLLSFKTRTLRSDPWIKLFCFKMYVCVYIYVYMHMYICIYIFNN